MKYIKITRDTGSFKKGQHFPATNKLAADLINDKSAREIREPPRQKTIAQASGPESQAPERNPGNTRPPKTPPLPNPKPRRKKKQ